MTKREIEKLESKKREWDLALRGIERTFRCESRKMINFIMFYKPKDKLDRAWHIGEMIITYIILQYAVKGAFGW
jgi:hypothetical protein